VSHVRIPCSGRNVTAEIFGKVRVEKQAYTGNAAGLFTVQEAREFGGVSDSVTAKFYMSC